VLGLWRLKFPSALLATGVLSLRFRELKFPATMLATGVLCYGFATDDPRCSVVDWSLVVRVLANEVFRYHVGDWRLSLQF
jgi:hypothetical protein